MLISELIAEIKWEAKLEQDSSWDSHLLLLIWDEMVSLASLQNDVSLYISQFPLTIANQTGAFAITTPALLKIDRIEYEASTGEIWFLPNRDDVISPVPLSGKPRAYEIQQGSTGFFKIKFSPNQSIGPDILYLSYWGYPPVPNGGDTIYPISWIQSLKVNCIRRAQIFNASSSDLRAQLFAEIQQKAEAVNASSSKNLAEPTNDKGSN